MGKITVCVSFFVGYICLLFNGTVIAFDAIPAVANYTAYEYFNSMFIKMKKYKDVSSFKPLTHFCNQNVRNSCDAVVKRPSPVHQPGVMSWITE